MTDAYLPDDGPDYRLCGFPGTRPRFRGPAPDFREPFVAVLGGTETFGKYVDAPFPSLVSDWTGLPVMNFGVPYAGVSLFNDEPWLLDIAAHASLTVIQVLGAQNMSNRLYAVHPRRNDRFLSASPALCDMYPDVDFSEINFTGHLMKTLSHRSTRKFSILMDELRVAWVQRTRRLIEAIGGEVLLLWISDRHPDTRAMREPLFVDTEMLDQLSPLTAGVVKVVLPDERVTDVSRLSSNTEKAARLLPGPADHARIAEALVAAMSEIVAAMSEIDVAAGRAVGAARRQDQSFSISSGTAVKRSATSP